MRKVGRLRAGQDNAHERNSPKQKELFKKRLEGLHLTKTEQEYYSRSVKKKVIALTNAELHGLARKLLEK